VRPTSELLRVAPALVETVAQLLWVAARDRQLAAAPVDEAGLVPLLLDAPLDAREAAAFEAGLEALLRESSERGRGTYLREVRDRHGVRRELGVPVEPGAWRGEATLVGPFSDEAAAEAFLSTLLPPLLGDVQRSGGSVYVDAFRIDEEGPGEGGAGVDTTPGEG
jgi:hypothetical protein